MANIRGALWSIMLDPRLKQTAKQRIADKEAARQIAAKDLQNRSPSVHFQISTDSDLARRNNRARNAIPSSAKLRVIGRGTCGTVFEIPGTETVYREGSKVKALWNDYNLTNRIRHSPGNPQFCCMTVAIDHCNHYHFVYG